MSWANKAFFRFVLKKFYRRLWLKIAVAIIALLSIPGVFLGVMLIGGSQRAVKDSVLNNRRDIAARAAEEIYLWLKTPQGILAATAETISSMQLDPWRQETVLVGLVLSRPLFIRASSFDLSGAAVASSELGRLQEQGEPDSDAIRWIIEEKPYVSRIKFRGDHTPYISMAVPLKAANRISGFLMADVDLRGLWDIVDNIRLGNTGRAFLVSYDGTLLAHADKKQVLRNENLKGEGDVSAVLRGRNEAAEISLPSGMKLISSYAPVADTGWGVVIRQEQREAYLFARMIFLQLWIIFLLSGMVMIFIVSLTSYLFIKPIDSLSRQLKGISEGEIQQRLSVERSDEIGSLVRVFNELADKLKKAKAAEKFSNVPEAAAWVAHELKNSLAPIKSFIQLLPSKHDDGKFIERLSNVVPEEIARCEKMLRELTELSAGSRLNMERVNVKEIADTVIKTLDSEIRRMNIAARCLSVCEEPYIQGDPGRLKQLFVNLIINAIAAMPDGGELKIMIGRTGEGGSCLEVKISDTGTGIAQERLKDIFEPFKSTKKEGMGLGLTICRKIVQQHKGEIFAESSPGSGAIFTVIFPADASSGSRLADKI